ncbi:CsbD family protein [Streptomyces broussonetiae]|uniref:CsbD family protein n=1 Tax=Streptomyces broussonetiae TaxID=2686304 RepID=A0A6I6NA64_9ACTN|nr:CsbD family protein [Streptomyces broussonetiae]QHA08302.1 CsbD family protein [Streptomyces broussonetiae]
MAGSQKAKGKMEQATGKAKEAAGRAVGNEQLTGEGRAKKAKGAARQAKEKTKDIFKG